jgi:hypothetical protein
MIVLFYISLFSKSDCLLVLCCIVLYCVALCCIVLYCVVLCCIVLCCVVLCCIVLYCVALCCIVLHCVALCCIVLYCVVLCCIVLYLLAHWFRDRWRKWRQTEVEIGFSHKRKVKIERVIVDRGPHFHQDKQYILTYENITEL